MDQRLEAPRRPADAATSTLARSPWSVARRPAGGRLVAHTRAVRLLVCGTADRGDDGAALSAIAGLLPGMSCDLLAAIDVRRCEQLRIDDLVDLPAESVCVVVDSVVGITPGEIVSASLEEVVAIGLPGGACARSSHAMPLPQLVEVAGILRGIPLGGAFIGLGGRSFGYGRGLGRTIRAALPRFRHEIESEIVRLALAAERRD
jgi:hypothetical protein